MIEEGHYESAIALEFKEEGQGELFLSNRPSTSFTWVDNGGSVSLNVDDIVIEERISVSQQLFTESAPEYSFVYGNLILESLDISLADDGSTNFEWRPRVRFVPEEMESNYPNLANDQFTFIEPLIDAAKTPRPEAFGAGPWLYNYNHTIRKLTVDANGSATQRSLDPSSTPQPWANWQIQSNNLLLNQINNDVNHSAVLYVLDDLSVGYRWAQIEEFDGERFFSSGLLIKEDEPLVTSEADWIGIWSNGQDLITYTDNHTRRTNIAGWINDWHFDAARQTLVFANYVQGDYIWSDACNPLSPSACESILQEELRIVNKRNNNYWKIMTRSFLNGGTFEQLIFETKIPSVDVFGDWVFGASPLNLYEAMSDEFRVWTFANHKLLISDIYRDRIYEDDPNAVTAEIVDGKIHLKENENTQIIELIEHNENGLRVCQYPEESSCTPGTEIWLSSKSPAKMSVSVEGEGYVDYLIKHERFGFTHELTVTPKPGHELDKVEGCDGTLNGNVYVTGPVRQNCTVVATFRDVN